MKYVTENLMFTLILFGRIEELHISKEKYFFKYL